MVGLATLCLLCLARSTHPTLINFNLPGCISIFQLDYTLPQLAPVAIISRSELLRFILSRVASYCVSTLIGVEAI
jgi:hypothetical protein